MQNTQDVKRSIVWDPRVHKLYGEELDFLLIDIGSFSLPFKERVKEMLDECGIKGRCIYEVFGEYDLLLRVWLNFEKKQNLLLKFQSEPNIRAVAGFVAHRINYLWSDRDKPISDKEILRYDPKDLEKPMDETMLRNLERDGLILKGKKKEEGIKFYSILNYSGRFFQEDLADDLMVYLSNFLTEEKQEPIGDITLYSGEGFAHFLVKGVAKDFYGIYSFIVRLINTFKSSRISSQTLLVASPSPEESDEVDFRRPFDPVSIKRICSILEIEEELVRGLEISDFRRLEDKTFQVEREIFTLDTEGILRNLFHGFIKRDTKNIEKEMGAVFPRVERNLRSFFVQVMAEIFGKSWQKERLREIAKAVEINKPFREYTAYDYVCVLGKVDYQRREISKYLGPSWEGVLRKTILEWRNKFAHGMIDDPLKKWEEMVDLLVELLPIYYRLEQYSQKRR